MTLILAVSTDHGSYLAADSRSTNPRLDTAQKIFQCGANGFIGLTGTLVQRAEIRSAENRTMFTGTFDFMEVLRDFSLKYRGDGRDLPRAVAECVQGVLRPFWQLFVDPSPASFVGSREGGTIFEVPVLARVGRKLELRSVSFSHSASGKLQSSTHKGPYDSSEHFRGWGTEVDADEIELKIDSREGVLETIAALYARTVSLHEDTVGGPVDIGFLDVDVKKRGRWLVIKDPTLANL